MSVVIKVGGRAQNDPRLAGALAAYWERWQGAGPVAESGATACCVVHGGGDEVTALQRAAGIEPTFVGGRRVTRPDDIDRLRMALSGLANKRLVAALRLAGVRAVGLSGEDGPLLLADVLAGGTLGAVGEVRIVDTTLITTLVAAGYLPVIAPVAALYIPGVGPGAEAHAARRAVAIPDAATSALNINGDDAASAVAVALGAAELLLVSDVAGVRIDGKPVAELTPAMAERAIADGEIAGGMVAKVRAALGAIECGVPRVRIGTLELLDGSDRGTVVATSRARLAHASTSQGAAA